MPTIEATTGNDAIAEAMRQVNPDVVPVYPITPQTAIVEAFSSMVSNGLVDTHLINTESEHSAMSAAIGATAAGARVMTATASQGLAFMWEMLHIASSLRLPVVMCNVNRTLSAPINIHCDYSDSMGARDSGWIQLYSENAQEAYDNMIQAVRIAENTEVLLPVMVLMDGFIISHSIERVQFLDDSKVKEFVGSYNPSEFLLNSENPIAYGAFDSLHGYYFEFKRAQQQAMLNAYQVIEDVGNDFAAISDRSYSLFEEYKMEDADVALVAMGSAAGTMKETVDSFRSRGVKLGLLKIRVFRPFPVKELVRALSKVKTVGVFDRSHTFAGELGGQTYVELCSAFYNYQDRPLLKNYIYGLGGRDLNLDLLEKAVNGLMNESESSINNCNVSYLGLRDKEAIT